MARLKTTPLRNITSFAFTLDQIAVDQLYVEREKLKAEARIQKIRADLAESVAASVASIKANLALAEAYAIENRDEVLPEKKKTGEVANASYGFRLTPASLKQLNRKWTAEASIEALRSSGNGDLVVVKEALDKDGIKRRFDGDDTGLAAVGLRVEQTDEFWVEPKRDQPIENRLTA